MSDRNNHFKTVSACFLLLLAAALGTAQPAEPSSYYGEIRDEGGDPAPAGTEIYAVVDGDVEASIELDKEGVYGEEGAFGDKLSLDSSSGEEVIFRVSSPSGTSSQQSPYDLTAGTTNLDLVYQLGTFEEDDGGDQPTFTPDQQNTTSTSQSNITLSNQTSTNNKTENRTGIPTQGNLTDEPRPNVTKSNPGSEEDAARNASTRRDVEISTGGEIELEPGNLTKSIEVAVDNPSNQPGSSDTIASVRLSVPGNKSVFSFSVGEVTDEFDVFSEAVSGEKPQGLVYSYASINASGSVENSTIRFKVDKSFIESREGSVSDVSMQRYDNGWQKYDAVLSGEEEDSYVFESGVPGFSVFAITLGTSSESELPLSLIFVGLAAALFAVVYFLKQETGEGRLRSAMKTSSNQLKKRLDHEERENE